MAYKSRINPEVTMPDVMTSEQCAALAKIGNVTEQDVRDTVTVRVSQTGESRQSACQWLFRQFHTLGRSWDAVCDDLGIKV